MTCTPDGYAGWHPEPGYLRNGKYVAQQAAGYRLPTLYMFAFYESHIDIT
jgi:hypothetical protein